MTPIILPQAYIYSSPFTHKGSHYPIVVSSATSSQRETNKWFFFPFQNIILWEESNEMMVMKEVCVFGVIKQLGIIRLTHKKREWWNHIIYLHHLFKFTFYITSCYITYSKKYATVNVYLHHLLKYPFYNKTCYIIYSKRNRQANMIVAKYISTVIYYDSLIT